MNDPKQAITTAGQHELAETDNKKDTPKRFTFAWRSKGLGAGAKNIDELIAALEDGADALRVLKDAGVFLDAGKVTDDDAYLVTTDPAVAQRFGFAAEVTMKQDVKEETATDSAATAKGSV
jgi:hypothetical protein